jgi:hypothetical protein
MPPGASGDHPAQRGELKGLGEVAQRQLVPAQLLLEHRPRRPRSDSRRQRHGVHFEHAIERAEVQRDDAVKAPRVDGGFDAPDYARPAAEGDDRRVGGAGPLEHRLDPGLVHRMGDDVGRVVKAAPEGADDIAVGAAVGVKGALVGVGAADRAQGGGGVEAG